MATLYVWTDADNKECVTVFPPDATEQMKSDALAKLATRLKPATEFLGDGPLPAEKPAAPTRAERIAAAMTLEELKAALL